MGGGWQTRPSGHFRDAGWSTAPTACLRTGEASPYRRSNRAPDRRLSDDGRDGPLPVEDLAEGLGNAARQDVLSRSGAESQPTDGHRISSPAKCNHGVGGGAPARSQACSEFEGAPYCAFGFLSNLPSVRAFCAGPECYG